MSKELKRNDLCHCGSGTKYKNCHAKRGIKKPLPWMLWGVLLALVGAFSLIPNNKENGSSNQYTSKPYMPQNIGKNKPEGEAPPGMVWSAEHGHWHDAKNPHDAFSVGMKKSGDQLQRQGEVPPGKVWSPEHGHWHDKK